MACGSLSQNIYWVLDHYITVLSSCEIDMIPQTFHKTYMDDTLLHSREYKDCFYLYISLP